MIGAVTGSNKAASIIKAKSKRNEWRCLGVVAVKVFGCLGVPFLGVVVPLFLGVGVTFLGVAVLLFLGVAVLLFLGVPVVIFVPEIRDIAVERRSGVPEAKSTY